MQPYLKIIEQPKQQYRFRYKSESKHPEIYGVSSNKDDVTYPTVELLYYNSQAVIKCALYQVHKDEKHYHTLLEKDQENINSAILPYQGSYRFCLSKRAIVCTSKKDLKKILKQKYTKIHPDFGENQIYELCNEELKSVDLNEFRLRFSAHDIHTHKELCATYSQPIKNMKSSATNQLVINKCTRVYGDASGGDDVVLLTGKISKINTEVHIVEINKDGREILVGKGNFTPADVHHGYAIAFRTPPYINQCITEPVKVCIQLVRTSNGNTSNKIDYIYRPSPKNARKRKLNKKEAFSTFFEKSASSVSSNSQCLPIITKQTTQFSQIKVPTQEQNFNTYHSTVPFDSYSLYNTNQYQVPNSDLSIQSDERFISNATLTPPNSMDNDGYQSEFDKEISLDDIQIDDILNSIQIKHNGEFNGYESSASSSSYNLTTSTQPNDGHNGQMASMVQNNSGFVSEHNSLNQLHWHRPPYNVATHSELNNLDEQINMFEAPVGTSNTEFQEFSNNIIPSPELENLYQWRPDGGGAKESEVPGNSLESKSKIKSETAAFFKPEDISNAKKLIKDIYENLQIGRRYEVIHILEELCEIKLTDGGTFLHLLIDTNQEELEIVVNLISSMKMLDILNLTNDLGQSILHVAVKNDYRSLASNLVAKGCDPMLEDYEGNNAIHYAVKYQGQCLEHLLSAIKKNNITCDLDAQNFEKQTALHLAAMYDSECSARLLLKWGASGDARDSEGRTALHLAAYDHCARALAALQHRSIVDEIDGNGCTALQIVCGLNYSEKTREIIKLLLLNDADPFKPSRNGKSAVDYAKRDPEMWRVLKDAILEVNISRSAASESEDEFFSADEDLNDSEDLTSELLKMTLNDDKKM